MFKRCTLSIVTAAVLSMLTFSAQAKHIQDSYIVVFKEPLDVKDRIVHPPKKEKIGKVKFMENTNDQDKDQLAKDLKFKGKIIHLLESMNAMYVNMTEEEAQKWERDERVAYISQSIETTGAAQTDMGWGLDRLDSITPSLDNRYNDTPNNGMGRTIFVFDTGISDNPVVRSEFLHPVYGTNRLTVWDINSSDPFHPSGANADGVDRHGHGTVVAVAAAGKTYGAAKGANVISVRVTTDNGLKASSGLEAAAFGWLADNAGTSLVPLGSIVNYSRGPRVNVVGDCTNLNTRNNDFARIDIALEGAIKRAHDKGIIVVVAAHNDGCDTKDFSPTRIPEAFVVGATSSVGISAGKDVVAVAPSGNPNTGFMSRHGSNISVYGPGLGITTINLNGTLKTDAQGTSLATAYTSGVFATACQYYAPACDSATSAAPLYEAMRALSLKNTVVRAFDSNNILLPNYPLPLEYPDTSRFIFKNW